jgi:hypothetical protein
LETACKPIFHIGDLIGDGPYPKESMDFAFSVEEMNFVMRNHDHRYAYVLPNSTPECMSEEEVRNRTWIHH